MAPFVLILIFAPYAGILGGSGNATSGLAINMPDAETCARAKMALPGRLTYYASCIDRRATKAAP